MTSLILFGTLVVLLILNVPIAITLGLAAFFAIIFGDISIPLTMIPQRFFTSIDSFPFMAIPFFMLGGSLMEKGGLSSRLIGFAKNLVGFLPGGLGIITVFASGFFGAISGSNAATVAAIGGIMIPAMVEEKYPKDYATAVGAAAGTLGVVVPPSVPMITYGVISGVSIGTLFLAGFMPAAIMIVTMCIVIMVISKKNNYPRYKFSLHELWKSFVHAILAIMMPVIILGGIYSGIFTPTEAGAVSCVYSLIVTVFIYRELKFKDLRAVLVDAGKSSAIVFFVIATSSSFGWLLTSERIPDMVATAILGISNNKYIILFLMNVLLLILGIFLETNAIILLVTPMLLPIARAIGLDPLVLGLIMVVNTSVGMLTPPMALNTLIAAGIGKISIEEVSVKVMPLLIVLIIDIFILTYIPDIILFLPSVFGKM
ncbi:MAG: TRAP transporter large permease [Sedimentibacter sp.]